MTDGIEYAFVFKRIIELMTNLDAVVHQNENYNNFADCT